MGTTENLTISNFLRARYAEEKGVAWAASGETWGDINPQQPYVIFDVAAYRANRTMPTAGALASVTRAEDRAHIVRHGPARVLADLDAKLALVDLLTPAEEPVEPETDAQLHARRAHPAYEYATTTGPRKQWDDAGVPPLGDDLRPDTSWEPNTDAGDDGWERFDYTEECYWRRPRPGGPRPPYIPQELRLLATPFHAHPDYKETWRP